MDIGTIQTVVTTIMIMLFVEILLVKQYFAHKAKGRMLVRELWTISDFVLSYLSCFRDSAFARLCALASLRRKC